jgi:hypothetical protein
MSYEIIAFSVLIFIIALLIISTIRLQLRNQKLILKNVQDSMDKNTIILKLKEEIQKNNNSSIEQTDGFLKFISESRDWAFKYIEDAQAELLKFRDRVEPKFEYSNKFGKLAGESAATKVLDEIFEAYQDLKKIMPEDSSDSKKNK